MSKQDNELANFLQDPLSKPSEELPTHDQKMISLGWNAHKAHYEPLIEQAEKRGIDSGIQAYESTCEGLIQEARKATEAYGELKYDEGLLDGIQQAVKVERERVANWLLKEQPLKEAGKDAINFPMFMCLSRDCINHYKNTGELLNCCCFP